MKTVRDINSIMFPLEEVGEKECENCGHVYKLYKTSRGVLGACKPCSDRQVIEDFNLPTPEEYKMGKELKFIETFERVPQELLSVTVNSYKPKHPSQLEAKQAAIKFVKTFKNDKSQSLVFSGTPGLGKSHLAFAIAKAIKEQRYKVLFIKSTHLLQHFRNTYKANSKIDEDQLFKMIEDLDLLVLDDVGSEYVKANEVGGETWASDVLYNVFDSRLNKSTICTTNYSESEIKVKYGTNGPRINSRMRYRATAIRLEGDDQRLN